MKSPSTIRTRKEPLHFHKEKGGMDPFKFQLRIPGTDIPGFGKHYPCLALNGSMAKKPARYSAGRHLHLDPCFWNRGGGRWFHTKRRGGQVGRQRDRSLPRAPFPA